MLRFPVSLESVHTYCPIASHVWVKYLRQEKPCKNNTHLLHKPVCDYRFLKRNSVVVDQYNLTVDDERNHMCYCTHFLLPEINRNLKPEVVPCAFKPIHYIQGSQCWRLYFVEHNFCKNIMYYQKICCQPSPLNSGVFFIIMWQELGTAYVLRDSK